MEQILFSGPQKEPTLDLELNTLTLDFQPPNCETINLYCLSLQSVTALCSSSPRTQIHWVSGEHGKL